MNSTNLILVTMIGNAQPVLVDSATWAYAERQKTLVCGIDVFMPAIVVNTGERKHVYACCLRPFQVVATEANLFMVSPNPFA